jgi:hypothetical protein
MSVVTTVCWNGSGPSAAGSKRTSTGPNAVSPVFQDLRHWTPGRAHENRSQRKLRLRYSSDVCQRDCIGARAVVSEKERFRPDWRRCCAPGMRIVRVASRGRKKHRDPPGARHEGYDTFPFPSHCADVVSRFLGLRGYEEHHHPLPLAAHHFPEPSGIHISTATP